MSRLKILKYSFILLVLFGKNTFAQKSADKYTIYSMVIEQLPPMPPPSVEVVTNDSLLKRYIDSIGEKKVHIKVLEKTISPREFDFNDIHHRLAPEDSETYEKLAMKLNSSKSKKIEVARISHEANVTIAEVSVPPKLEYDPLVTNWNVVFSDVILDKSRNVGILYTAQHLSELAGSYKIYLLKYNNHEWFIYKTIVLAIS